jgi:hypothetical protein
MLGCEVVREPTNRKNHSLKEENGKEQQTNNSFFLSFSFLVLFLYSNHMMLDVVITLLRAQLDQRQQQLLV